MAAGRFSLERFEQLAYAGDGEPAMVELARALTELEENAHRPWGGVGLAPSGDLASERRDVQFATRIAAAVSALFLRPGMGITDPGFKRLVLFQRWLSIIFGASALGTADHLIRLFGRQAAGQGGAIATDDVAWMKSMLLYSMDSGITIDPEGFWRRNKRHAAAFFLALLSARIVATPQAHATREMLLGWLPERLEEMDPDELPLGTLHNVWMYCSYASDPDKHRIKGVINRLLRQGMLRHGLSDLPCKPPASREKPVLLCILEWFDSRHAMFRCYGRAVAALRSRFRVVGVGLERALDEPACRIFDEVRKIPGADSVDSNFAQTARQIIEVAREVEPDVVFYPSVGMLLETLLLVNLRLAPIQIASLGHPATTGSPMIDYVVLEEDLMGDPACFTERVVLLPRGSFPFEPLVPAGRGVRDAKRDGGGPVRVAICATVMKLNARFLSTLAEIASRVALPVEFHFFAGGATGLSKVYLGNVVRQVVGEMAIVHPQTDYGTYLRRIRECDLFLNPFPFGNTNGIVDTVGEGLPGVCLDGAEVHSRVDGGLFRRLGLPEWLVAASETEYVSAAVRLISDAVVRSEISAELRTSEPLNSLFQGNSDALASGIEWVMENDERLRGSDCRVFAMGADTR